MMIIIITIIILITTIIVNNSMNSHLCDVCAIWCIHINIQVLLLMQCIKVYRPPQLVYVLKSFVILCTFYINNHIISLSVYSFRSVVPHKEGPLVASYDRHVGRLGPILLFGWDIPLLSPVPTWGTNYCSTDEHIIVPQNSTIPYDIG